MRKRVELVTDLASHCPKRSGWDLIEDGLYAVKGTASVMTLIADHIEDEENRASAFDTLTRHLNTDLEALRKGVSKAHAKYSLVPRDNDDQNGGSVVPFEPRAGAEGGDAA